MISCYPVNPVSCEPFNSYPQLNSHLAEITEWIVEGVVLESATSAIGIGHFDGFGCRCTKLVLGKPDKMLGIDSCAWELEHQRDTNCPSRYWRCKFSGWAK